MQGLMRLLDLWQSSLSMDPYGHTLASAYVYMLFPACAFLATLSLVVFNAQVSLLERKSRKFMSVMKADLLCGHDRRKKEKLKQLDAMTSLTSKKSIFGHVTVRYPAVITEQVINAVLLLLNL